MSQLQGLIHREQMREVVDLGKDRQFAEAVFTEWRDRYVSNLCGYIRTYDKAARLNVKLPEPYRSREWCNAAVLLLTVAEPEIQDRFMRSTPEVKDRYVEAVLQDRGVFDMLNRFVELPV